MNEPLEGGGVLAPAGCGDSAPHLQPLGGGRQKLPPKRNRRALAGRTAHARAPPCSPAATCLFHAAELLPSINSNLAWSLPLRPDPPWGLGLGRGRRWLPRPPAAAGLCCRCPLLGLGFPDGGLGRKGGRGQAGFGQPQAFLKWHPSARFCAECQGHNGAQSRQIG